MRSDEQLPITANREHSSQTADRPSIGRRDWALTAEDPLPHAEDDDRAQIVERLQWTPKQRLDYLLDMLAFEERARKINS